MKKILFIAVAVASLWACSSSGGDANSSLGGATSAAGGAGGSTSSNGGSGITPGSGGNLAAGGTTTSAPPNGTGGYTPTAGGSLGVGGIQTGGANAGGGSGAKSTTGGVQNAGGSPPATGGRTGTSATGGVSPSSGGSHTGGVTSSAGGAATGGAGTGGVGAGGSSTGGGSSGPRIVQNFNQAWKFKRADVSGAQATTFDDSTWGNIGLPHSFGLPYFASTKFYVGYGWYRKHFTVPSSWSGMSVFLEFQAAFDQAQIYVNGTQVGQHIGGYNGFSIDITSAAKTGDNVVAVRLNNNWNAQIPPLTGDHTFQGGL